MTFNVAASKPRVRDATHVHGHSARLRSLEASRRDQCLRSLRREHPDLACKYTLKDFQVRHRPTDCRQRWQLQHGLQISAWLRIVQDAWQAHKSQLGREAGQDHSLLKMSSGFRQATMGHFRTYAMVTLEELAVETGSAEDHLTAEILEAFHKLRHPIVRRQTSSTFTSRSDVMSKNDMLHD